MAGATKNISTTLFSRFSSDVTFGDVTYPPRSSFGPRLQQDYQLVVVLQGEARILINSVENQLRERHVALLKPENWEHFYFSRVGTTRHTWCSIKLHRVAAEQRLELDHSPFCLPLSSRLQSLMELGLSSPQSASPIVGAQLSFLGDAALQQFLADWTLGNTEKELLPAALLRAKQQVETQFAAPLNIETLAKTACCTPNHLTRLFRQHLRTTPARYLWDTRVNNGVEMLRHTGLTVVEIAARTGFQTPFHFSRLVSQKYGVSPRQLRMQAWTVTESEEKAPKR